MKKSFVIGASGLVVAIIFSASWLTVVQRAFAMPTGSGQAPTTVGRQTQSRPTPTSEACLAPTSFDKLMRELMLNVAANSPQESDWQVTRDGKVVLSGEGYVDSMRASGSSQFAQADEKGVVDLSNLPGDRDDGGTVDLSNLPGNLGGDNTVDLSNLPGDDTRGASKPRRGAEVPPRRCCMYTAKSEPHNPDFPFLYNFLGYANNFQWNKTYGCDAIIHCRTYDIAPVNLTQILTPGVPPVIPGAGETGIDFDSCQTVWPMKPHVFKPQTLEQVIKQEQCSDPSLVSVRHGHFFNGQYCTTAFCKSILPLLKAGAQAELVELTCHTASDPRLRCSVASLQVDMLRLQCQGSGAKVMSTGIYGEMQLPFGGVGCSIADPTGAGSARNVNQLVRTVADESGFIICHLTANGWEEFPNYCGENYRKRGDLTGIAKPKGSALKCT
jgi:hypothetical protein